MNIGMNIKNRREKARNHTEADGGKPVVDPIHDRPG